MNNILPLFDGFLKRLLPFPLLLLFGVFAAESLAQELPIYAQLGQVDFKLKSTLSAESPALSSEHGLERFEGQAILLFFGFTHCPQICPLAVQKMVQVRSSLSKPEVLQLVFISVDAQRDTVSRLRTYLAAFDADIVGFTGSQEALKEVADRFAATFFNNPDLQHTDRIFLLDQQGQVRQLFEQTTASKEISAAVEGLLKAQRVEKAPDQEPVNRFVNRIKEWFK